MAKKRAHTKDDRVPLEFLYGDDIASDSLMLRGMHDLERELNEQFKQERTAATETARHMSQTYRSLFKGLGKDDRVKAAHKDLRKLSAFDPKQISLRCRSSIPSRHAHRDGLLQMDTRRGLARRRCQRAIASRRRFVNTHMVLRICRKE